MKAAILGWSIAVKGSALIVLVLTLLTALPSFAVVDIHEFDDEVTRQRYLSFVEELRCPKCQNQNLAGSDSPIASDLRRELRRLLEDERSDTEIVDFMVQRYGEYVLYKPKLQRNTMILWGLPLLLLAVALCSVLILVRRRRSVVGEPEGTALTAQQQQRLDGLLAKAGSRKRSEDNKN